MNLAKANKGYQLPLPIDKCDICIAQMEIKYGYRCCPLGTNPYIGHPNPNEAVCKTGENYGISRLARSPLI